MYINVISNEEKTTNKNIKLQNAHFSILDEMKTKMCSLLCIRKRRRLDGRRRERGEAGKAGAVKCWWQQPGDGDTVKAFHGTISHFSRENGGKICFDQPCRKQQNRLSILCIENDIIISVSYYGAGRAQPLY